MPVTQQLADRRRSRCAGSRGASGRAVRGDRRREPHAATSAPRRRSRAVLDDATALRSGARSARSGRSARRPSARSRSQGLASHHPADVHDGAELARAMIAAARSARASACWCRAPKKAAPRRSRSCARPAPRSSTSSRIARIAVAADDPSVARGRELLAAVRRRACARCSRRRRSPRSPRSSVRSPRCATRFCAIGETTAAALRAAGVTEPRVAPTPTPEGWRSAVRAVYHLTRQHELPRLPAAPDAAHREPPPHGARDPARARRLHLSAVRGAGLGRREADQLDARAVQLLGRQGRRGRGAGRRPRHPGRDPVRDPRAERTRSAPRRGRTAASSRRRSARSRSDARI